MNQYSRKGFFSRLAVDNSIIGFFVVLYQVWSSRALKIPSNDLILLSIGIDFALTTVLLAVIFRRFTLKFILGWSVVDRLFVTIPLAIVETKVAISILTMPFLTKLAILYSVGWPLAFTLLLISYTIRMKIYRSIEVKSTAVEA